MAVKLWTLYFPQKVDKENLSWIWDLALERLWNIDLNVFGECDVGFGSFCDIIITQLHARLACYDCPSAHTMLFILRSLIAGMECIWCCSCIPTYQAVFDGSPVYQNIVNLTFLRSFLKISRYKFSWAADKDGFMDSLTHSWKWTACNLIWGIYPASWGLVVRDVFCNLFDDGEMQCHHSSLFIWLFLFLFLLASVSMFISSFLYYC